MSELKTYDVMGYVDGVKTNVDVDANSPKEALGLAKKQGLVNIRSCAEKGPAAEAEQPDENPGNAGAGTEGGAVPGADTPGPDADDGTTAAPSE